MATKLLSLFKRSGQVGICKFGVGSEHLNHYFVMCASSFYCHLVRNSFNGLY